MHARINVPLAFLLGLAGLDASSAPLVPDAPLTSRPTSPRASAKRSLQGAALPAPRAHAKQSRPAADQLTESVVIHGRRRDQLLWTDPTLVAELGPSAASTAAIRAEFPGAVAEPASGATLRLWRCPRSGDGSSPARRLRQLHPDAPIAEVFRATSDPESALAILPGGVFVYLVDGLDPAAGATALRNGGFQILETLPFADPAFLVASGPGAAALDVVDRALALDAIACAMPVGTVQIAEQ